MRTLIAECNRNRRHIKLILTGVFGPPCREANCNSHRLIAPRLRQQTLDPNNLTAKFFIHYQTGSGLPCGISGGACAQILWLINPAPGAAGQIASGELHFVGATYRYRTSGLINEVVVSPDCILMRPVPDLTLDYFLPAAVYGDDPFTAAAAPPVPCKLRVRVKNSGHG